MVVDAKIKHAVVVATVSPPAFTDHRERRGPAPG
jgi:hypothetical protein